MPHLRVKVLMKEPSCVGHTGTPEPDVCGDCVGEEDLEDLLGHAGASDPGGQWEARMAHGRLVGFHCGRNSISIHEDFAPQACAAREGGISSDTDGRPSGSCGQGTPGGFVLPGV